LVRQHGRRTATMIVGHEFINAHVTRIEAITRQLGIARSSGGQPSEGRCPQHSIDGAQEGGAACRTSD
jgi:hypothetical protein